ncbi:efflux RND transporter periplasmic adaptor subunit [Salegentibacter salegens]|uniref:RND family efflux transporter, MFP subunit n=1 Tax=Salegentibacter salegens TaxID=143223 RepID=A0A1M7NPT8_9FLAO|nr:efflux RND transporter periplasmic adaptor subunit [Salegentibacter salegens]PRX43067.1 RND family efflux transporter MFP subunit [Salegentibacter salegens]SHN05770.1 RND family efflux transporter, MFP subunit [Salegentibacter salegens]
MKTKLYILSLLGATTLLFSCGDSSEKNIAENSPAVLVTVETPSKSDQSFLTFSGKIEAAENATLSTRNMGYVTGVNASVGDKVRKGQLLIEINNADLQAKRAQVNAGITEATAAFNNAEKDYERYNSLFEDNSASQKEMDDITARYEMAKARLEAARQQKNEINAQFAYSNIVAPFSGVVTAKNVEVGDMANPGMPLLNLEVPGKFEVRASVPESEIASVKQGTEVDVLVKSSGETLKGMVSEISTSARNSGGQYVVKVALDETDASIYSGMYASVQFPTTAGENREVVLIPASALVTRGDLHGIYTPSQQNTAILRWLRLGRTIGDEVEVLSGLNAGESYISSAEGKLFNGARLEIR